MKIDYGQDPTALVWAEQQSGFRFRGQPAVWLTSRRQDGSILGVVIFSRFTDGNCEISVAGQSGWLTRRLILASVAYTFVQMEMRRVTAFIAVQNEKSLNLAQRLGFRIEGTARDWFPTGDAYILGLTRNDCKWLKEFHGLGKRSATA